MDETKSSPQRGANEPPKRRLYPTTAAYLPGGARRTPYAFASLTREERGT